MKSQKEAPHPARRNGLQVLPEAIPNIVNLVVAYGNPQHTLHINDIMIR